MDDQLKLTDIFFHDAAGFLRDLQQAADELAESNISREEVDRAFRAAHSIKSESSYLNFSKIADQSNRVENRLEELKSGGVTDEKKHDLLRDISELIALIDKERTLSVRNHSTDSNEMELEKGIPFTEFEQKLIREARRRGEFLYRLYCEIDQTEQMVFPRLFLLINNLELEVNVIKTIPELDEDGDAENEIQIFFTSSLDESQIYRIISIDQIARIQITTIDYDSLPETKHRPSVKAAKGMQRYAPPSILRVDAQKFEELKTGIEEIELSSRELIQSNSDFSSPLIQKLSKIIDLTGQIGKVMQKIYLISVKSEFNRLKTYAEQLAGKLGKELDVILAGGEFEIDTRFLEVLSDVLVHIVRNAVDHGAENPEERELMQKSRRGVLVLSGFVYKKEAVIQIIDDGRGIETEDVNEKSGDPQGKLMDLLSQPGFTTRSAATNDSGRGYGLNIAVTKLAEIPNSSIRVVSRPGEGSVFTLTVPAGYTNVRLLVAKHNNRHLCFQKKHILSMGEVSAGSFSRDDQGKLFYRNAPVFTQHGRITKSQGLPEEKFAIELGYLDRTGFLLVNEILFEKEIFEKQINRGLETEPHLYSITLGGLDQIYYLVGPGIILND